MDTNTNNGAEIMDMFNPFPGTELADHAEIHGRIDALKLYRKVTGRCLADAYAALDFAYILKGIETVRGRRVGS